MVRQFLVPLSRSSSPWMWSECYLFLGLVAVLAETDRRRIVIEATILVRAARQRAHKIDEVYCPVPMFSASFREMYNGQLCCFHEGRFTSVTRPSITFISCDGMLNTVRYSSTKGSQIQKGHSSTPRSGFLLIGRVRKCRPKVFGSRGSDFHLSKGGSRIASRGCVAFSSFFCFS